MKPHRLDPRAVSAAVLRLVPELEAVALTLRTERGAAHVLAASEPWAVQAEELQYSAGEGPGLTAFTERREVAVPDLQASRDWPGFGPAAGRIGVAAVFAVPLPEPLSLGTLTFYRRHPGLPAGPVLADARTLAGITASVLTAADLLPEITRATTFDEVHRAAGALSVELRIDVEEARLRLRAAASARDLPLLTLARAVLADPHLLDT